jgi:hypothetical protein
MRRTVVLVRVLVGSVLQSSSDATVARVYGRHGRTWVCFREYSVLFSIQTRGLLIWRQEREEEDQEESSSIFGWSAPAKTKGYC